MRTQLCQMAIGPRREHHSRPVLSSVSGSAISRREGPPPTVPCQSFDLQENCQARRTKGSRKNKLAAQTRIQQGRDGPTSDKRVCATEQLWLSETKCEVIVAPS